MASIASVKATVNGTEYTLTWDSTSQSYKATITAPSTSSYNQTGHYYNVSVTAKDTAGNSTTVDASDASLGSSLQLKVKEKVAPTITFTSPTSGATITSNKPTITFKVLDSDSGVASASLKVDGTTVSGLTVTTITGGKQYSYTPSSALSDGSHTIIANATDNDGNAATATSISFKVDTTPPVLNVTSPADGSATNQTSCSVAGTTNDATSSPVTVTITLNGTDTGTVTVDSSGAFSKTVTLAEGSNTIVVTSTDSAGKSSSVTRTVELDTSAPVFTGVTITPNPVDAGATYVISVTVTD